MGRAEAAGLLCVILADPALPYRARWASLGAAPRRGHLLNRTAVGRVVAGHLVDTHAVDEVAERDWPRDHKDWLQRCLNPQRPEREHPLDVRALTLFCDAFTITPTHRAQLWAIWDSPAGALILSRPLHLTDFEAPGPIPLPPVGCHCVAVLEEHDLGPDQRPCHHRSTLLIAADVDNLDLVTYTWGRGALVGEIEQGGRSVGPVREIQTGLWGQDIFLERALDAGERLQIVSATQLHHDRAPRPEYRRAAPSRPGTPLEIRIRFDPGGLPVTVSRCVWANGHPAPIMEAPAEVDDTHTVGLRVTYLQPGATIGFRWTWPA